MSIQDISPSSGRVPRRRWRGRSLRRMRCTSGDHGRQRRGGADASAAVEGHRAGIESVRESSKGRAAGIKVLTLYGSVEKWRSRSRKFDADEAPQGYLRLELKRCCATTLRFKVPARRGAAPDVQRELKMAEEKTQATPAAVKSTSIRRPDEIVEAARGPLAYGLAPDELDDTLRRFIHRGQRSRIADPHSGEMRAAISCWGDRVRQIWDTATLWRSGSNICRGVLAYQNASRYGGITDGGLLDGDELTGSGIRARVRLRPSRPRNRELEGELEAGSGKWRLERDSES